MSTKSPDEGLGSVVEFRIHGIGNQPPWHALGEPRAIGALAPGPAAEVGDELPADSATPVGNQPDRFILSFSAPDPAEGVWLINWARTSRHTARFNWFLVIPLTMVNVAGYMRPRTEGAPGRKLLPFAVHVVSGWMSISVLVWLVVLVETVLKHAGGWHPWLLLVRALATVVVFIAWRALHGRWLLLRSVAAVAGLWFIWSNSWLADAVHRVPWELSWWPRAYLVAAAAVGLAATAAGWLRWKFGVTKAPIGVVAAHSIITALATLLVLSRPVRWTPPDWLPGWAVVPTPGPAACDTAAYFEPGWVCGERVDLVSTVVVLSVATAVVMAVLLLLAHLRTPPTDRTPNLPGAALLLVLGPLLLHTLASVTRVSIDWLLSYVGYLVRFVSREAGWPNPIAFRVLTPSDVAGRFVYGIDIVVLLLVAFAAAVGLASYAVVRTHLGANPVVAGESRPHRIVQGLPTTLAPSLLAGLVAFAVAASYGLARASDESSPLPGWAALFVVLLVQGAALFVALLYSGRLARARDVLSRIADVAGFWPVTFHPLAGSSYRPQVLRGIAHEINRSGASRAVVVGHSQGSVLAACIVGSLYEAPALSAAEVKLLTCGCPLSALYAAFFPDEFDVESFAAVRAGAGDDWVNCWRAWDGIASEVPANTNHLLPDPREEGARPRGHGDYWTDPKQVECVRRWTHPTEQRDW